MLNKRSTNGWVIDGLTEGMADRSVDGSRLRWMNKWMEKMKVLAVGLPESLLSTSFLDFKQMLFAIFFRQQCRFK